MKKVEIFSDGSCLGNPGRGGYGVILRYKGVEKELSHGFVKTTNNRMELMGAIVALQALKEPCEVVLTTDSKYVIDGITKWIFNWKSKNWPSHVVNKDLWIELERLNSSHKVTWVWVKGHEGHTENERCDLLARNAAAQGIDNDVGYN